MLLRTICQLLLAPRLTQALVETHVMVGILPVSITLQDPPYTHRVCYVVQLLLEGATFSAFALLVIFVSPTSSDSSGAPRHGQNSPFFA